MESHVVPTLGEVVLHGWISCASVGLPVLKNQKTKVSMPELSQRSGSTRHFGSRGPLCVFVLGKLRAKERDRKIYLIILSGHVKERGLVA